jgi:O-antigen ligase
MKKSVNKFLLAFVIVITMLTAGLIATNTVGFSYMDRLLLRDKTEDVFTVNDRFKKWQEAFKIGSEHFLFGVGLGNYTIYLPAREKRVLFGTVQEKITKEGLLNPHNLLFFTFAETGIIGLGTLLIILFFFIKIDLAIFKKKSKEFSHTLIISFWCLFLYSLFNPTTQIAYNALFWYLRAMIYYESTN